jgi:hypothetical protein
MKEGTTKRRLRDAPTGYFAAWFAVFTIVGMLEVCRVLRTIREGGNLSLDEIVSVAICGFGGLSALLLLGRRAWTKR